MWTVGQQMCRKESAVLVLAKTKFNERFLKVQREIESFTKAMQTL